MRLRAKTRKRIGLGIARIGGGRVVLVGQAPSRRSDPARPLSGRSGDFLSTVAGFKIGAKFDLRNLLDGFPGKVQKGDAFPLWKARIAAWALSKELTGRRVILLGQNVARAFGVARGPLMTWDLGPWPLCATAVLPHPSGINAWWNSPLNRLTAEMFLRKAAGKRRTIRDKTRPRGKWRFNEEVATAFGDMLKRSIPQIEVMREATFELGRRYVRPETYVLDLGSSRGDALAPFVKAFPESKFLGYEVSPPMRRIAEERFHGNRAVSFSPDGDIREASFPGDAASLVLSVLTLQFVPINARQEVLRKAHLSLRDGGALILIEKVLGNSFEIDQRTGSVYHAMKERNGYSREEIERKRLSLEGVLVPLTASWNEDLLREAGFGKVDVFWACMNFRGWIAVK